jgi:hypothetical protein
VLFPLLSLIITFSFFLGPEASLAQSGFIIGDVGAPPNQNSVQVPGAGIQQPSYSGPGCPRGSASATLSPDGKTLSILFDTYIVEVGSHVGRSKETKTCQIHIPFKVSPGYQVQVVKMDYRGFFSLPAGARATFGAGYRFLDPYEARSSLPAVTRGGVAHGPRDEDFMISSFTIGSPLSPCGQDFILAADSSLKLESNGEQALSTIDSLDAVHAPVQYSLRWSRCDDESSGAGGVIRHSRP